MGDSSLQGSLQGVVRGMGSAGDNIFRAETADDVTRLVELSERSKSWTRAVKTIQVALPSQLRRGCPYVGRVSHQAAEVALQAQSPGLQVRIAKGRVVAGNGERSDLMRGRKRGYILLVAIQVNDGVGGNGFGAVGKNILPLGRVDPR